MEVDGWQWQRTFDRKGHADARAQRIAVKHAHGWWFDPGAVDMIEPEVTTKGLRDQTVMSSTLEYIRSGWPAWRPNTRRHYVRYLSRARRWLLRAEAPTPDAALSAALDRYVSEVSLRLSASRQDGSVAYIEEVPDELAPAVAWLDQWSLPLRDVTPEAVRGLVSRYDYYIPKHGSDVPPPVPIRTKSSTREGMVRHTKSWWNWVRDAGQVAHDPFRAARRPAQAKAALRADRLAVDPDIVLDPAQLFLFARHVMAVHRSGDRWSTYAPLLGLAGLRPGEALGLRRRCFELPLDDGSSCGWLALDEQRPTSTSRHFIDPEDRNATTAPLKGRDAGEGRRVPIFPQLAPLVRRHLDLYVEDHPDALFFTGVRGGALDPKWFAQQIWEPARATFVEELRESRRYNERVLRKLESLRRHDLRHAAASFWLRVPVSPKLAQRWGGWRDLSTFLDVYQGLMTGEEDAAVRAVSAYLEGLDLPDLGWGIDRHRSS